MKFASTVQVSLDQPALKHFIIKVLIPSYQSLLTSLISPFTKRLTPNQTLGKHVRLYLFFDNPHFFLLVCSLFNLFQPFSLFLFSSEVHLNLTSLLQKKF